MQELTHLDEADLRAELDRREAARKAEALRLRMEQEAEWLLNIDALLRLVPNHSRTSCSDERHNNGYDGHNYRCVRCVLLNAKEYAEWPQGVTLEVHLWLASQRTPR